MNDGSNAALITFAGYTVAVFVLAILSTRSGKKKEFVGEYFLGSRSFGVWAFALTFAATNASGGSFMGFPALIYSHGWSLALWISGFMFVPLIAMGLIGKRLNQVARRCDALTIPEVFRGRFESPAVGLTATGLLVFFMFFYLLAQFKAGGKILSTLLSQEPFFQTSVEFIATVTQPIPWVNQADPDYLVCLLVFSAAVIVYVVYGGFRAVVWTDVMQGVVMFVGVLLLLGLAVYQVGGLDRATRDLAKLTPPQNITVEFVRQDESSGAVVIPKGSWFQIESDFVRTAELATINQGTPSSESVDAIRLGEHERPPEFEPLESVRLTIVGESPKHHFSEPGTYVRAPGPSSKSDLGFLALGTAISFFIFWPFAATGQPSNMVRLMSFKDTKTLRYSMVTVAFYYSVIYFSLVVVFCCGRVLMPGMEIDPDRTMPELATMLTRAAGVPWLAGLLVAAPFAAVMSSVDSFLLMVSSCVVRDIYQGHVNRDAPESRLRRLSYGVTVIAGVLAVIFVINPPTYLQDLIIFASGGLAACFLMPMVLTLYWPRMTASGTIAGMVAGTLVHLGLTIYGAYDSFAQSGEYKFQPYELLGLNPFIWDLVGSALACYVVAVRSPHNKLLANKFFSDAKTAG